MKNEEKAMLREEFHKVWNDERMTNYCTNKVAKFVILPDGGIVTIDKQSIEKNFCFGESGYDYDDAQAMANHARKSQEYFKKKNMEYFEAWVSELKDALNGDSLVTSNLPHYMLGFIPNYTRQPDDCKLIEHTWIRLCDIIDALGGSAVVEDLAGTTIEYRGRKYRIATREEIELILSAYEEAYKDHEKKVNSYLKRYGTSKVHSWTYWRDA